MAACSPSELSRPAGLGMASRAVLVGSLAGFVLPSFARLRRKIIAGFAWNEIKESDIFVRLSQEICSMGTPGHGHSGLQLPSVGVFCVQVPELRASGQAPDLWDRGAEVSWGLALLFLPALGQHASRGTAGRTIFCPFSTSSRCPHRDHAIKSSSSLTPQPSLTVQDTTAPRVLI